MKLVAGSSNFPLAKKIAGKLKIKLLKVKISHFANSEKRVWVEDEVKGDNIILVQSFSQPTDEKIIEFLLLTDALERAGASHINFVLPWMGYSLQDKVFRPGEPIAAKVVADLVSHSYVKRIFLFDVHNPSIAGFFSTSTHQISAVELFTHHIQNNFDLSQAVVASPDFGGLKRSREMAKKLKLQLVNIDKHRDPNTNKIDQMSLHGEVKNKTVLVFDDVIVSGGTMIKAAKVLKAEGAKDINFFATHGVFAEGSAKKLAQSAIDSIVVTNSVAHHQLPKKITVLDCADLFVEKLKDWL